MKNNPNSIFQLQSPFQPSGDQPQAINELLQGLKDGIKNQVLLGVTGSGKTYTMAKIIEASSRPTLIMAPNKTLAAQLYSEMKEFFPQNHVEYFVSYYDYYQPEAYVPKTDTYIEKDSAINEQIDRMRNSATRSLLEYRDVIIVASVSCIYGLGDVDSYSSMTLPLKTGQSISPSNVFRRLSELQYTRNQQNFVRSTFRVQGDVLDIFPSHYDYKGWRISFFGDEIESISEFDTLTGKKLTSLDSVTIYPANHYVTPRPTIAQAIVNIRHELQEQIKIFTEQNKLIEAQRIEQRTRFDLEMLDTTGSCKGIENYSRFLTGRKQGFPPPTLFEYLPEDTILFIDESHVSVPQIGAMYKGDFNRKSTLSQYGFRLPSCLDNRPLKFDEWDKMRGQTIFVSATPGDWELSQSGGAFAEQIIRPTGLTDPLCIVKPATNQIDDLMSECKKAIKEKERILVTTLTKKMAEDLTDYLTENGIKVRYLHSDIDTLERIEIIRDLRLGVFDVLVGINLLREGLDIPECALVAILDADKEGFLRSTRSLIQTIGRAARNANGRVILYADTLTDSLNKALEETNRRRQKQLEYNKLHNIIPQTVCKKISSTLDEMTSKDIDKSAHEKLPIVDIEKQINHYTKLMQEAAANLEFEQAISYRNKVHQLEQFKLNNS